MSSGKGTFVERVSKGSARKPVIGIVYTEERQDGKHDLNETQYSVQFRKNLPNAGTGCQMEILDYHVLMEEFKTAQPDAHKELVEKYPPFTLDEQGVQHAPVIDVTEGSGKALKDFLLTCPLIQKLNGIAGPGDHYNVLGEGVNPSPDRMYVEAALYSIAKDKGIPVLAVCGSEQHIAYLTGTEVSQDVKADTGTDHMGRDKSGKPTGEVHVHDIIIKPGTMTHSIALHVKSRQDADTGEAIVPVNSLHRQGVINNQISHIALEQANFEVSALDPSRNIVEGYESKHGTPMVMLQSHPEYMNAPFEKTVMAALVDAANAYMHKQEMVGQMRSFSDRVAKKDDEQIIPEWKKLAAESRVDPRMYSKDISEKRQISGLDVNVPIGRVH